MRPTIMLLSQESRTQSNRRSSTAHNAGIVHRLQGNTSYPLHEKLLGQTLDRKVPSPLGSGAEFAAQKYMFAFGEKRALREQAHSALTGPAVSWGRGLAG